MFSRRSRFLFRRPDPRIASTNRGYVPGHYCGLPPAVQWDVDWMVEHWDLACTLDQEAFVNNPASPDETANGREWVQTQLTGSTLTVTDTAFPPRLRIATPGTATSGQSMQACLGAAGNTKVIYDPANAQDLYFSITMRLSDANNDNDTVEQCQFFVGFAPVDTTIFTTVDDFIGLHKPDGSGQISLVADQTAVAPGSASTRQGLINLNSSNANLINRWFTLHFHALGLDQTNQLGRVLAFIDYHAQPAGAADRTPTYLGEIDLDTNNDVPGAAMCPTIAFREGEAVAKNLDIVQVTCAAKRDLGAAG